LDGPPVSCYDMPGRDIRSAKRWLSGWLIMVGHGNFLMKQRTSLSRILLFGSCFWFIVSLIGCATQPTSTPPVLLATSTAPIPPATATPNTATAIGRIVLGYGDHSPVAGLPLWLGRESHGEPVTRTNAKGEFTLTGLPVGQVIDVADDHLFFQINVTSSGIIDLGTLEYPLIHP
jgi:hypothetical protein